MSRAKPALALIALALIGLAAACTRSSSDKPPATIADDVRATAQQVVVALSRARHGARRELRPPDSRSPLLAVPYVDTTTIASCPHATSRRSGSARTRRAGARTTAPASRFVLPYSAYHAKFVYDVDFQHAPRVVIDSQPLGRGNATNNLAEVYRGASIVEYHWPGKDPAGERYGLAQSSGSPSNETQARWYLVGVVHGAWTI